MRSLSLIPALCFCLASPLFAAGPVEVAKGSELRAELLDLARPTVVKDAGQPVKFYGSLRQQEGWAFFNGSIVDASGRRICVGDAESADTVILWKLSGGKGKVVQCAVGITDVG
jgi:hypothetical protein